MIFDNHGLSDLLPELKIVPGQIVVCTLPKTFALSIGGNDLKVALYHIDFCFVEHFSTLQPEI